MLLSHYKHSHLCLGFVSMNKRYLMICSPFDSVGILWANRIFHNYSTEEEATWEEQEENQSEELPPPPPPLHPSPCLCTRFIECFCLFDFFFIYSSSLSKYIVVLVLISLLYFLFLSSPWGSVYRFLYSIFTQPCGKHHILSANFSPIA